MENIKNRKFRDPYEFMSREPRDRYVISESSITPKRVPENIVEEVHRDILK